MFRYAIGAAALALAIVSVVPAGAQRLKAGVLTCDVSAGMGFIIGSQRNVSCVFAPEPAGPQQTYSGSISKFGLDIGATASGVMIWAYSPTPPPVRAFSPATISAQAAR